MEENKIPKRVLYMNLESTRTRGRPRNRLQVEVRLNGRLVGGKEWQEKVYNRKEWMKLLRMARNRCILHMTMERMNVKLLYSDHQYVEATCCNTGTQICILEFTTPEWLKQVGDHHTMKLHS
jgi:hypothetical protein